MKKRISTIILISIFVLGFLILMYPATANWWNTRNQAKDISNYQSVVQSVAKEDYSSYFAAADAFNEKLLNMSTPLHNTKELTEYEDVLNFPSTDIMAYIVIDRLKVELPIYHGTSNAVLSSGVGHVEGSSVPVGGPGTHCALSAHRGLPSSKLFSDLDEMEVGDTFTITVLDRLLTYQVDQVKVVLPEEMDDLKIEPDKDYVTLVTCTPYGVNTHRLLVRGHRIENAEAEIEIYVPNEAIKVDPMIVAPIISIPLILLVLIAVAIKYRKK